MRSLRDTYFDTARSTATLAYLKSPISADSPVIPTQSVKTPTNGDQRAPEDFMFDKAEEAEQVEAHRIKIQSEITKLEDRRAETKGAERTQLDIETARLRKELEALVHEATEQKEEREPVPKCYSAWRWEWSQPTSATPNELRSIAADQRLARAITSRS